MNQLKPAGLVFLFLLLLAVFSFRCGWGGDQIFNGSDANIGLIAYGHAQLPERYFGTYRAGPVFGEASAIPITFGSLGRWLMSPELFSDTWYGINLVLSSLFLIGYLKILKLRWTSALFGALAAFWVGSVTLSAAGHLGKLGVMTFFSLSLLLIEKALRANRHLKRIGFAAVGGLSVGMMLLEQQDVALLAGIFLGGYTIFRLIQSAAKKMPVWCEVLLPVALLALLMAAPTAADAYRKNVIEAGLQENSKAKWDFVTQWSMVPGELPDLIAPGYTGWSTGNPAGPYWGKVGRSAEWETTRKGFQNFRLDSLYLGLIPVLLAIFGITAAFQNRKKDTGNARLMLCWGALAFTALLLSFGKYFPFYKMFYHLPLVGNIRAPIKFLHDFQVMLAIIAAYGLDQLLETQKLRTRDLLILLAVFSGLFTLFAFGVKESRFSEWGEYAQVIAQTTRAAWFHAAVMALIAGGVIFCLWKKPDCRSGCALLLIGVMAADSLLLTRHYFKSENIADLKQGNVVLNYLKEHQGNERVFFLDQSGMYNRWLGVETAYFGINVFNIWQMPRMPQKYKNFLAAAGRNQIRLWHLSSVKYITAPASLFSELKEPLKGQFEPVMYYRFVRQGDRINVQTLSRPQTAQDQVLLEFQNYIPRFSLFHNWQVVSPDRQCSILFSGSFDPTKMVLVEHAMASSAQTVPGPFQKVSAKTGLTEAVVKIDSESAGILLFTQRWQPGWTVQIDGCQAEVLRCNYLCMGVFVPSGTHEVVFTYR